MGVAMKDYLDYVNGGVKTHSLWVAPLPRKGILNYVQEMASIHAFALCALD